MSAIKKGIKKIGKFVKKHWKTAVLIGAALFTGGLTIGSWGAFTETISSFGGGFLGTVKAIGSTMWAGATAAASSVGLGTGAQGTFAANAVAAGHGTTFSTGALASKLGVKGAGVSKAASSAAKQALEAGKGWKSALSAAKSAEASGAAIKAAADGVSMGAKDMAAKGASSVKSGVQSAVGKSSAVGSGSGLSGSINNFIQPMTASPQASPLMSQAAPTAIQSAGGQASMLQAMQALQPTMGQTIAKAAIPSLISMGGSYLSAAGQAEMNEPRQMWGYDLETGETHMPDYSNIQMPEPLMMPTRTRAPQAERPTRPRDARYY